MTDDALSMWTVYDRPHDFPHCFVARRFELVGGNAHATQDTIIGPTLEAVRQRLDAMGLHCITRSEGDDPVIVETWL